MSKAKTKSLVKAQDGKRVPMAARSSQSNSTTALSRKKFDFSADFLDLPRFKLKEDGKTVEFDAKLDGPALGALMETFQTGGLDLINWFMEQLWDAVPHLSEPQKLNAILPLLYGLHPRDVLETMLFMQMIGVHNVNMELMRRALHASQIDKGVEANVRQLNALTKVFISQMEALQKYRGKAAQQKVVVEHVHVNQGGQAIVGAVNSQRQGDREGEGND